jgi:hypothetical protein
MMILPYRLTSYRSDEAEFVASCRSGIPAAIDLQRIAARMPLLQYVLNLMAVPPALLTNRGKASVPTQNR